MHSNGYFCRKCQAYSGVILYQEDFLFVFQSNDQFRLHNFQKVMEQFTLLDSESFYLFFLMQSKPLLWFVLNHKKSYGVFPVRLDWQHGLSFYKETRNVCSFCSPILSFHITHGLMVFPHLVSALIGVNLVEVLSQENIQFAIAMCWQTSQVTTLMSSPIVMVTSD